MVKQHEVYSPQDLGQTKQNGGSTFCVKYEYLKMILDVFQNMVSQKQIFRKFYKHSLTKKVLFKIVFWDRADVQTIIYLWLEGVYEH
jgi:uncharacterized membrane protein